MTTGYEQVCSVVVAALAGDWEAARDVQLDLPQTGVYNSNPDDSATGDSCSGPALARRAARAAYLHLRAGSCPRR